MKRLKKPRKHPKADAWKDRNSIKDMPMLSLPQEEDKLEDLHLMPMLVEKKKLKNDWKSSNKLSIY